MLDDLYTMLVRREGADRHGRRHAKRRPPKGQRPNFPFFAVLLGLLAAGPAAAGHPSPADWRDLVIYQVITDRFANGDPANDAVEGNYDAGRRHKIHGGDFAGIRQRLDYLENLGVDAIWISPVVLNAYAEYHGYAARDFFAIAPHFGTLAELQALVAGRHARGIRVIIDVVVQPHGRPDRQRRRGYPAYKTPPGTYTLRWRNAPAPRRRSFDDLTRSTPRPHRQLQSIPSRSSASCPGSTTSRPRTPAVRDAADRGGQLADRQHRLRRLPRRHRQARRDGLLERRGARPCAPTPPSAGKTDFLHVRRGVRRRRRQGRLVHRHHGRRRLQVRFRCSTTRCTSPPPACSASTDPPACDLRPLRQADGRYDATGRERLVTFLDNHDNSRFLSFGHRRPGREPAARGARLAADLARRALHLLRHRAGVRRRGRSLLPRGHVGRPVGLRPLATATTSTWRIRCSASCAPIADVRRRHAGAAPRRHRRPATPRRPARACTSTRRVPPAWTPRSWR